MSETIERYGKAYEVGKIYASMDGSKVVLKGLDYDGTFIVDKINHDGRWFTNELSETKGSMETGTIKQAPVKLIDGEVYQFELNCTIWAGFYRESRGSFFTNFSGGNKICAASEACQISKLVPEEK